MIPLSDFQKIGIGLSGFGVIFLILGTVLFFDRGLLAMGNILFIAGVAFVIGMERTFKFFFQARKAKATGCFIGGILIVLLGFPVIGMIVELYGFYLLFKGFLPIAVNFLRRVPIIGNVLNLPGLRSLMTRVEESSSSMA
ncbi:vesicle transport protein GOT1B-like [Corticium candelabrum]|uniref:vesicle transport protein GOT1B-like n=1 Tax=Corticium candelabrum TaxID=121492 RepID=UPI002E258AB7|nr:vesicle transport protein GOT1B-like [Corticium candelabrum]